MYHSFNYLSETNVSFCFDGNACAGTGTSFGSAWLLKISPSNGDEVSFLFTFFGGTGGACSDSPKFEMLLTST